MLTPFSFLEEAVKKLFVLSPLPEPPLLPMPGEPWA
jgi:hypothetical protein